MLAATVMTGLCFCEKMRSALAICFTSFYRSFFGKFLPGGWATMSGSKVRSLVVFCNQSTFHRDPPRALDVCCCRQMN